MSKKALILGVSGQDGAYLAELLVEKGYEVHGTSRDHIASCFENLAKLRIREWIIIHSLKLDSVDDIRKLFSKLNPDEIYNLAGQSSVGLSFERPLEASLSIAGVTINILEAMRLDKSTARFFNAGSGEMFGKTLFPATEETKVNPKSPYGAAKAAAFHMVKNYREAYGLFASTGILFSHESPLRPQRFVTSKIVSTAVRISNGSKERLKLGKMDITRDWGWAPDYVDAMWKILQQSKADDYVISTGEEHSLQDFVAETFSALGMNWRDHVDSDPTLLRPSDINRSFGDASKAAGIISWKAEHRFSNIIHMLIEGLK
jgi:GDPmannose 4,6-dehydratase